MKKPNKVRKTIKAWAIVTPIGMFYHGSTFHAPIFGLKEGAKLYLKKNLKGVKTKIVPVEIKLTQ